jgi:hypothetical protein
VTLDVFQFQWEPTHKERNSTKTSRLDIIGKRLPTRHWIGEGDAGVDVTLKLTGAAYSNAYFVPPEEVGALRMKQALAARRKYSTLTSPVLSDSVDAMVKAETGTVKEAQSKIRDAKKRENASVLNQIRILKNLSEPQEDTGTPHPVYLNIGGIYAGRKFLLEDVDSDVETHNYFTMEPTEATVKLKFVEITDFRKRVR